jgi:hypothetical protein
MPRELFWEGAIDFTHCIKEAMLWPKTNDADPNTREIHKSLHGEEKTYLTVYSVHCEFAERLFPMKFLTDISNIFLFIFYY